MTSKRSHDELKTLAAGVIRLSRLLTREREDLPPAYLKDRGLREAYEAYYLPPNVVKVQTPLRALAAHPGKLLDKDRLRILDLGCGPGTSILGVLDFFAQEKKRPLLDFTAVDHIAENLKTAEGLFKSRLNEIRLSASLRTVVSPVEQAKRLTGTSFDLIIFSNVLNELFGRDEDRIAKRAALVSDLLQHLLLPEGSCIIIEPALRETSRDLLCLADGLREQKFMIYAPCLCHTSCPALVNPKDWCHEDIPWNPPELIRELDKLTGLRKDSLKFSYIVVRKDNKSIRDVYGEAAFRVVSEPLVSKGKMEFFVCGESGRKLITRLDKDETASNEAFGALRRGDVVDFENLIDEGKRYKIIKETQVKRLTPK